MSYHLGKERISIFRQLIILLMLLFCKPLFLSAQEERIEICIDFRVGSTVIDSTYMDNAARLTEIIDYIASLRTDTTRAILQVAFNGVASPEGNSQRNQQLARGRMEALEDYVRSHIALPDSLVIAHDDHYIPWDRLISMVEESDIPHRDEVLTILCGESKYVPYNNNTTIDSRVLALQALRDGSVWNVLNRRFFDKLRNACAVFLTMKRTPPPPPPAPEVVVPEPEVIDTVPDIIPLPIEEPLTEEWVRHLYVKTNTVGAAMLIANLAIEVDIDKHWSFSFPVYYSAHNYFRTEVKFRTTCMQPELRYWFSEDNDGWFAGAHLGIAWYNYAKGGAYRYQDHSRYTPALGGGISGGYRMPLSKNRHWWMEFSLGTGVYHLHYDVFENKTNGRWLEEKRRTFFGIDRVAVSFAYRFNVERLIELTKKGGRK